MATMQPPMMAPGAQPGAEPTDPNGTDDQTGSYTIEIEVRQDGTFAVSVESGAQEAAEGQGGMDDDKGAKECTNVKEALTIALGIVKNGGEMPDMGADDAAFMQGYGGDTGAKGA